VKFEEKHIAAIYFSPRNPSNSGEILDITLKPLIKAGWNVEKIFIRDLNIRPCEGCETCEKGALCPIEDDVPRIKSLLEKCSAVAIATPVYFYGVPSSAKALIDRCQTLWARKYIIANPLPSGRQAGIIVTAASGGQKVAEGVRLTLKYFLDALSIEMPEMHVVRNCHWAPKDVPCNESAKANEYGNKFLERINNGL
jgi:multimeric flavodoxin WrbA